jgi:prepilin peptidase CpaA
MFRESPYGPAWGALFTALLIVGCLTDVRARRIPNPLVFAISVGGLCYSIATRPVLPALGFSLAGALLGFAIWIVFYIGGVMGAGDVKFFAAAGTWLGPAATWRAALVAALAGGVLAVSFLLYERRLGNALRRMAVAAAARSAELVAERPENTAAGQTPARRRQLPYGVAMAVGALVAGWWPGLLK